MTPAQIALVQSSLPAVLANGATAARLFYGRLFEIDPSARRLFAHTDMDHQGTRLVAAIATVVGSLHGFEAVERDVRSLARRHAGYGVTYLHYQSVGAALLWTLEQVLGDALTPELRRAWAAAYRRVSDAMQGEVTNALAA
jgi:hemoglobin-like flavoprotein